MGLARESGGVLVSQNSGLKIHRPLVTSDT